MNSHMNATAPFDDMFVVLRACSTRLAAAAGAGRHSEVDADLMQQVLDEAGKFVGEVVAPLNRERRRDRRAVEGRRGHHAAGFPRGLPGVLASRLACAGLRAEDGGQGLPAVLEAVLYEMLSAPPTTAGPWRPGLLHGAYECIRHHGSDALKARYLEKLATGEWLATMCLTEPHAGSDLGLVRTKAVPLADGRYALSGHQDLHLRRRTRPDRQHRAPGAGAPARRARRAQGPVAVPGAQVPGRRQPQRACICERIEEKMGLHGSPTCVMRFDEAAACDRRASRARA